MRRLVAFGCSCTFGTGLDDCLPDPVTNKSCADPSNLAWPKLIADKLNLGCVNNGKSGISNKGIWHKLTDYDFKQGDIVLVMWTNIDRTSIIKENKLINIGAWGEDPVSKWYYRMMYNDNDHKIDTDLRIAHASSFLSNLGINHYHLSVDSIIYKKMSKDTNFLNIEPFRHFAMPYELAPDNNHPGKEVHIAYAEKIMNELHGYLQK